MGSHQTLREVTALLSDRLSNIFAIPICTRGGSQSKSTDENGRVVFEICIKPKLISTFLATRHKTILTDLNSRSVTLSTYFRGTHP